MSLSGQNRATFTRVFADDLPYTDREGVIVSEQQINALLDDARAEGVAALQQAGEPVEITWQDIRLAVGEGPLKPADVLAGANAELRRRAHLSPLPQQPALVEQGVEKIIAQHEPAACGASAPSEPPRSAGQRLCESFAATFEGGGWADAPEWENFDDHQHKRWERAAEHFLGLSAGGEGQ